MNLTILETKTKIIKVLNESRLPLAVMDLILGEIKTGIINQLSLEIQHQKDDTEAQEIQWGE